MFLFFREGEVGGGIWVVREWIGCYVGVVGFLEGGNDVVGYAGSGIGVEVHCFEGELVEGGSIKDVPS